MKLCEIEGCEKPARSAKADKCPMHYHRWYRHGDAQATNHDAPSIEVGRYRTKYRPRHPLAMRNGNVYVHRMVLYDAIGAGMHACHWCGRPVEWDAVGVQAQLTPDHLNADREDNRPENLVPSCMGCNVGRGSQRRSEMLRADGAFSHHDTVARLRVTSATQGVHARAA